MSGLRFIEANPFDKSFDNRVRQREGSRRARLAQETGEFRLGEAERASQEQQARNRALSKTVGTTPRGTTLRDVGASNLAAAGQGTAAFEQGVKAEDTRAQQATKVRDRSDAAFDNMISALGSGQPEAALSIAQRSGMKITPSVQAAFNNSFFQRELKARFDRNKQAFKDPRQFEKQMQRDVVELLGAVAANRGGVPQRTDGGQRVVPTQGASQKFRGRPFPTGQDRNLNVLNDQGQAVPVRSADGTQLTAPPSRAGRDPNLVTPLQRATLVQKFLDAMNQDFFDDRPPEAKMVEAEARADRLLRQGEGGTDLRSAGVPDVQAPQVSPESAVAPAPAVAPPSRSEAQRFFLAPLPMLSDGTADVGRLQVGQVYNTARGPLRYTGIPGREFTTP